MTAVKINTEYITLCQFVKYVGLAYTGGDAKAVATGGFFTVNGEPENRRGRKLRNGDIIKYTKDNREFVIEG